MPDNWLFIFLGFVRNVAGTVYGNSSTPDGLTQSVTTDTTGNIVIINGATVTGGVFGGWVTNPPRLRAIP